ncbi:Multi antimicrobial extrusion protein [Sesbania bispinosa]|nr:Multi antimicrobial extrusion protein [Sesbania bispinosa]
MDEKQSLYSAGDWRRIPICTFFKDARLVFKLDSLGREILSIALPAAMALTADPIASLVDTAFIGQIGPVELAAVGVSIALFNQVSRIAIFPLVSVTTSFVAEEDTLSGASSQVEESGCLEAGPLWMLKPKSSYHKKTLSVFWVSYRWNVHNSDLIGESLNIVKEVHKRRHIPSASSALFFGGILGIIQAILLISAAKPLLNFMGVTSDSPMLHPAQHYLTLRSLGAPAVLLSLATQGVFRGFKDTKTPLYATVAGDVTNIALDPLFMFVFRMGVSGAAIAHVNLKLSCPLSLLFLLLLLTSVISYFQVNVNVVIAVTFCVTLAASLAARQGSTSMAAFQVCLQVWLAVSLLADGLAVAGQAILAGAFANKDRDKATATASRVLQMGLVLGFALAFILGTGLHFGAKLFTKDDNVLHLIKVGIPFVALTQPLNSLAFVLMVSTLGHLILHIQPSPWWVVVAIISIICLLILSSAGGFIGIWVALTIYMSLRAFAGFLRIGTGSGPWEFLRS